jgi:uncharacterized protein
MRLALESDPGIHLVRSYGEGVITIGSESVRGPCVVSPHTLRTDWAATSIAELTAALMEPLLATGATIILLGSDESQLLPPAALRQLCRTRAIALESMNLGAACRTYNILAGEQRAVVAGLFPG